MCINIMVSGSGGGGGDCGCIMCVFILRGECTVVLKVMMVIMTMMMVVLI